MNTRYGFYTLIVDDVDGDGLSDVGFACESQAYGSQGPAIQFSGDRRYWLALYRIDGDTFRSLLPERELDQGGVSFGRRN